MVLILNHDERVARGNLVRDIPGGGRRARASAHTQASALTQGIEREAAMLADDPPVGCLDRSGVGAKYAGSKIPGTAVRR